MSSELFAVSAEQYCLGKQFEVYWPASLDNPKSNAVMFVMPRCAEDAKVLFDVENCLVFWDESLPIPKDLEDRHAVVKTSDARGEYCRFFKDNGITHHPQNAPFAITEGAYICDGAQINGSCTIMPGAYIGPEVQLGKNAYIGCGAKLVGRICAGDNLVVRENTVIGADGLSTDRDVDGTALTMPQFGGVIIGDDVKIGANVVIARGAIDDTVIESGCKIDNSTFISHNVRLGQDTFVVGETIMFGGSHTGARAFLSGNVTVRNKAAIGDDALVGMGAVVTKDVPTGAVVMGNPAKQRG